MTATAVTSGHHLWFKEARQIIDLTQRSALPIPMLNAARASFSFVTVTHAPDTRSMVEAAEQVLAREFTFIVPFFTRQAEAGSSRHRIRTAVLDSGLHLDLVALAAHFDGEDEAAPVLQAVAA